LDVCVLRPPKIGVVACLDGRPLETPRPSILLQVRRSYVAITRGNTRLPLTMRAQTFASFAKLKTAREPLPLFSTGVPSWGTRIPLYIPPGAIPKENRPKYDELDVRIVAAMNSLDVEEADRTWRNANATIKTTNVVFYRIWEAANTDLPEGPDTKVPEPSRLGHTYL
jgi:hypothetical protein